MPFKGIKMSHQASPQKLKIFFSFLPKTGMSEAACVQSSKNPLNSTRLEHSL